MRRPMKAARFSGCCDSVQGSATVAGKVGQEGEDILVSNGLDGCPESGAQRRAGIMDGTVRMQDDDPVRGELQKGVRQVVHGVSIDFVNIVPLAWFQKADQCEFRGKALGCNN